MAVSMRKPRPRSRSRRRSGAVTRQPGGGSQHNRVDSLGSGFATRSFALLLQCGFQKVNSISQILEPTFGVDVEPIEDLYGVVVGML